MRALLLIASSLLLACAPEAIEALDAFEAPAPDVEQVELWFEGSDARWRVTRTLHNQEPLVAHVDVMIELPSAALVDALRIETADGWLEATLRPADEAFETWMALPGAVPGTHPAVLLDRHFGGSHILRARALGPDERLRVQYDVRAPLRYEAGAWRFDYVGPAPELREGGPRVLNSEDYDEGTHFTVERADFGPLQLRWAALPLVSGRSAWRLELEAGAELAPLPDRARFVFAVDASRSMDDHGIASQLTLIPQVLAQAPDAEVEVIVYRRFAERLFGRFVPAAQFAQALASVDPARLVPGNGSNLDAAIVEVRRVLDQVHGPARAILFTDEELRSGFEVDTAAAPLRELKAEAFAHLVSHNGHGAEGMELTRVLSHELAELAHAGGGVMLDASGVPADEAEARALEVLVRPVRLEDVRLEVEGVDSEALSVSSDLEAGEAFVRSGIIDGLIPRHARATGLLWSRRVELSPAMDWTLSDQLPAKFVIDEPSATDEELAAMALRAHAVSEHTSFVIAPGQRLIPEELGIRGFGFTGGWSCGGAYGTGRGGGYRAFGPAPDLGPLVRSALAGCGEGTGVVRIEVQSDEILDVSVEGAASPEAAHCLGEAMWSVMLPNGTPPGSYAFTQ